MTTSQLRLAQTEEQRQAVFRLRYEIYVEEMGRYGDVADHENRWLVEPEDARARIFLAEIDGRVVATARTNWGGDHPFTERHLEQYKLAPFLAEMGSPLAEVLHDFADGARIPECVGRLIDETTVYTQETTSAAEYWSRVHATLRHVDPGQFSLFDDLSEDQTEAVLAKSSIIRCRRGDRVLKEGNTARNMFVVLEGVFEMRRRNETTVYLSVGDVFGEMAFLTGQPREMDILSFTDGARVLCLSESALRGLIDEDPGTGARVLLNLSRMLCVKILRISQA